jgi:hypothetical protein
VSPAPSKASPTPFADLNEFLDEFVSRLRRVFAENFVGAYLVGSFALGAGDAHSDVDFIVVTEHVPDPEPLNELHRELFVRDSRWATHLEGSYLPRELIRTIDPARTKVWFLDHGSQQLALDEHCNTALVRWTLFHHGVTLAGPEAGTLVDAVADDDLREEARALLSVYREWASEPDMNGWRQPYLVLSFCRMRCTLDTARIVSKPAAVEWALVHLDSEWHELIVAAQAARAHVLGRVNEPAEPAAAARTRAFAEAMR